MASVILTEASYSLSSGIPCKLPSFIGEDIEICHRIKLWSSWHNLCLIQRTRASWGYLWTLNPICAVLWALLSLNQEPKVKLTAWVLQELCASPLHQKQMPISCVHPDCLRLSNRPSSLSWKSFEKPDVRPGLRQPCHLSEWKASCVGQAQGGQKGWVYLFPASSQAVTTPKETSLPSWLVFPQI